MPQFKVGDKVRVHSTPPFSHTQYQGLVGRITEVLPAKYPLYTVQFPGYRGHFDAQELQAAPENNKERR